MTKHSWVLLAALLLSGCSPEAGEAIGEAIAEIILVMMLVAMIALCVGVVVLGIELTVVVLNFARPSRVTMVAGYVLAGLHGFSVLGTLTLLVSSASADPAATPITDALLGLAGTVLMGGLLGGSAYYAQQRLAEQAFRD